MRLALNLSYSGATMALDMARILEAERLGDDSVWTVQDLYLAGVALCGPRERIREHLAEWKRAGVTTIQVVGDAEAVRTMAELVL